MTVFIIGYSLCLSTFASFSASLPSLNGTLGKTMFTCLERECGEKGRCPLLPEPFLTNIMGNSQEGRQPLFIHPPSFEKGRG